MKHKYLILITCLSCMMCFSQNKKLKKADQAFNNYDYVDVIKTYEILAEMGYSSPKMTKQLADSYYYNSSYTNAAKWYKDIIDKNPEAEVESQYYFRYALCLKSIKDYSNADKMMSKYIEKSIGSSKYNLIDKNLNYLERIKKNSDQYKIKEISINSEYSDFGGTVQDNKLIFSSSRKKEQKLSDWNKQVFSSLYVSQIKDGGEYTNPTLFDMNKLQTNANESSPVFSIDNKTMYYTKNETSKSKKYKNGTKIKVLKIYKASKINGIWKTEEEVPFNSNEYSVAHPSLNNDGTRLYFVSDMPGSYGGTDIFYVNINEKGEFSSPINIGTPINTDGNETFPYISSDEKLFFASNGHQGLGGLDVFVSQLQKDNSFGEVSNLGTPINSELDDFAFSINPITGSGYFSSNRQNGKGFDDIYSCFEKTTKTIKGTALDKITKSPLKDIVINVIDENNNTIQLVTTDENGQFTIDLTKEKTYRLLISNENFATDEIPIVVDKNNGTTQLQDFSLLPSEFDRTNKIKKDTDLAYTYDLQPSYFEFKKWTVNKKAIPYLQRIAEILKIYPKLKIDLRTHTDSFGTNEYNLILSRKRAESTYKWLINNGVNKNQLTYKGYGETQMVNHCTDGVECTPKEHQANRRTEFIVTDF